MNGKYPPSAVVARGDGGRWHHQRPLLLSFQLQGLGGGFLISVRGVFDTGRRDLRGRHRYRQSRFHALLRGLSSSGMTLLLALDSMALNPLCQCSGTEARPGSFIGACRQVVVRCPGRGQRRLARHFKETGQAGGASADTAKDFHRAAAGHGAWLHRQLFVLSPR